MPTRRRRLGNVGNGNGARRRHSVDCTCPGCQARRDDAAWDAGGDLRITVVCPHDHRHALGRLRFEAGIGCYTPVVEPKRATVVEQIPGHGYGHTTGDLQAALKLSAETISVTIDGRAETAPRHLIWSCYRCIRAGRIGEPGRIRLDRMLRLALAMRHREDRITVACTPAAIAREVERLLNNGSRYIAPPPSRQW